MELTKEQIKEIDDKLTEFDKYIESSIELQIEQEKESWNNGEYSYLIERFEKGWVNFSDSISEELEKYKCSFDELLDHIIETHNISFYYEELSSPFDYGGAEENELECINCGGDKEIQIDYSNIEEFIPSFKISEYFNSFAEFAAFVNYEIGKIDHLDAFYRFINGASIVEIVYNTDYNICRVLIKDEEEVIKYIQSKEKVAA